jgi:hypothetical protein
MLKAVELWSTVRPLFERSSQVQEVHCVDERLTCVVQHALKLHSEDKAHLVELNIPSGNPSPIKHEEQVELTDQPFTQVGG